MVHTIAEIKDGAKVWMYIPDLDASHPLLWRNMGTGNFNF